MAAHDDTSWRGKWDDSGTAPPHHHTAIFPGAGEMAGAAMVP